MRRFFLVAAGATAAVLGFAAIPGAVASPLAGYSWKAGTAPEAEDYDTLAGRFPPPAGFVREPVEAKSWAAWLRGLPLKPRGSKVYLYSGGEKWRQDVHAAVIDIDVDKRDLQQCADAVMRLRAEWLFALDRKRDIAFNNTNGKSLRFADWKSQTYPSFRKYMIQVFAYAGTYSLSRELVGKTVDQIQIGDVFILGGFPGHAVLVADMAVAPVTGKKVFMLVQSYMPAQDIHVLKNPGDPAGGVWYPADFGDKLVTPEWHFAKDSLKSWPR